MTPDTFLSSVSYPESPGGFSIPGPAEVLLAPDALSQINPPSLPAPQIAVSAELKFSQPPTRPVPGPVRLHPQTGQRDIELRVGEAGSVCLGAPRLEEPGFYVFQRQAEARAIDSGRIVYDIDTREGLWVLPSNPHEPPAVETWLCGIRGPRRDAAHPLPAHGHHIRVDREGARSVITHDPAVWIANPHGHSVKSMAKKLKPWDLTADKGGLVLRPRPDYFASIPEEAVISLPRLKLRLRLVKYCWPAALTAELLSSPANPESASIRLQWRGTRPVRIMLRGAGTDPFPPMTTVLSGDNPERLLTIPPAACAGPRRGSVAVESDETVITCRVRILPLPPQRRLACYPPLIVWGDDDRTVNAGVVFAPEEPADFRVIPPPEMASCEWEPGGQPGAFRFHLAGPRPGPPWAGCVTVIDIHSGARGYIPVIRLSIPAIPEDPC
ncbi:MAG: hypothetical protein ACE15F_00555 [bacterium]